MKEIYTSNHMWKLFENFLVDICRVSRNVFYRVINRRRMLFYPILRLGDYVNTGCSQHMLTCHPHAGSVIQWLCIIKCFFILFIHAQVCNNTSDRKHADTMLERYVTETVMSIVTCFFSSPFSDQSTSLQVIRTVDVACEVYIISSLTVFI